MLATVLAPAGCSVYSNSTIVKQLAPFAVGALHRYSTTASLQGLMHPATVNAHGVAAGSPSCFINGTESQHSRPSFPTATVISQCRTFCSSCTSVAQTVGLHKQFRHQNGSNAYQHVGTRSSSTVQVPVDEAKGSEAGGSDVKQSVAAHGTMSREDYMMMHPVYDSDYMANVQVTHKKPVKLHEKVAYYAVQSMRSVFDWFTGYTTSSSMTESQWLRRILFLETVAGVPGMVGAMLRHMKSLRTMRRDNGWIHTLLEEAENERMHLLTFMQIRQPGPIMRLLVLGAQGVFFNGYLLAYLVAPRTCHAFVGYLEEEAVKTYTHCLAEVDAGRLPGWAHRTAPNIAIQYWQLPEQATMRDLLLAVRADEAAHKHVNHTLSELKPTDPNPFGKGSVHLP